MRPPAILVSLTAGEAADAAITGNKFARLATVHDIADVPLAWCVPAPWFTHALGPARMEALAEVFHDVAATAGHDLINLDERLTTILDPLTPDAELWAGLAELAENAEPAALAVRSSSITEDGGRHSHAGLYDSYLNVRGTSRLAAAVTACWRSFYQPRAVLARLRTGDNDPSPRMAVIVQHMVPAELAGVAFTHHTRTTVSATTGTGERLVAGTIHAAGYDLHTGAAPPPYDEVVRLAGTLRKRFGHHVDLEWAWNHSGLRLLQVRPVTAALTPQQRNEPCFVSTSLYFTAILPSEISLDGLALLYAAVTGKRSHLFRLAVSNRIKVSDGWVVTLNGAGLTAGQLPGWWRRLTGEVVVDLGPAARQNIIDAAQVTDFLSTTLNLSRQPYARHTFLLRPFIRGQAGAVTRLQPGGRVLMEHSAGGLLVINRGLGACRQLPLPAPDDASAWKNLAVPEPWTTAVLYQIACFTGLVDSEYPGACLEWAFHDGDAYLIDYSITEPAKAGETTEGDVFSPGSARGPLLVLGDDTALARLSIAPIVSVSVDARLPESHHITHILETIKTCSGKPIVYAKRPYAILSQLIGYVAGFVFAGGSTLCHLAILLREAQIPAVVVPELTDPTGTDCITAVIDNGNVHLVPDQRSA